jgi:6-phosphogluconolactonase (cycloisomerase 2 family)
MAHQAILRFKDKLMSLLVMDQDTWPFEVRNNYLSQCYKLTISLDDILFTINEKTSTLTAQQIPQAPNGTTLPLIANVSIIPTDITLNATFAGAELIVSEPTEQFPDSLIYVSNRNLGPEFDPRGDSIAIFQFSNDSSTSPTSSDPCSKHKRMVKAHARQLPVHQARQTQGTVSGNLTLVNQVFTGLKQIRSMAIGPVSIAGAEEFLIAGANVDGGVVMYERTNGGRNLTELVRNTDVQNRTSFVFI